MVMFIKKCTAPQRQALFSSKRAQLLARFPTREVYEHHILDGCVLGYSSIAKSNKWLLGEIPETQYR